MLTHISAVERAFQLAGSGLFCDVSEVKRYLKVEGYSEKHVIGPLVVARLGELIANSSRGHRNV